MQISIAMLHEIFTFKTDTVNALKIKLQMPMIQKLTHLIFSKTGKLWFIELVSLEEFIDP